MPEEARDQMGRDLQHELASVLAAAVHMGWLSVQEGVCDTTDCMSGRTCFRMPGQPTKNIELEAREWSRLVCEQYLKSSMAGTLLTSTMQAVQGRPGSECHCEHV